MSLAGLNIMEVEDTPRTKLMTELIHELDDVEAHKSSRTATQTDKALANLSSNPLLMTKSIRMQKEYNPRKEKEKEENQQKRDQQDEKHLQNRHRSAQISILDEPSEDHGKIFSTKYWGNSRNTDLNNKSKANLDLDEIQRARKEYRKSRSSGNEMKKPWEMTSDDDEMTSDDDTNSSYSPNAESSEDYIYTNSTRGLQHSITPDNKSKHGAHKKNARNCRYPGVNENNLKTTKQLHARQTRDSTTSVNESKNNPGRPGAFMASSHSAVTINSSSNSDKDDTLTETSTEDDSSTESSSTTEDLAFIKRKPYPVSGNKSPDKVASDTSQKKKDSKATKSKSKTRQRKKSDATKSRSKKKSKKPVSDTESEETSTTDSTESTTDNSNDSQEQKNATGKKAKPTSSYTAKPHSKTTEKPMKDVTVKRKDTDTSRGQALKISKSNKPIAKKPLEKSPADLKENRKALDMFTVGNSKSDDTKNEDTSKSEIQKTKRRGAMRKGKGTDLKSSAGSKSDINSEKSHKSLHSETGTHSVLERKSGASTEKPSSQENGIKVTEGGDGSTIRTFSESELKEINELYYAVKWDLIYLKRAHKQLVNPLTMWKKLPELNIPPRLRRPREKLDYVDKKIKELENDRKILKKQRAFLKRATGVKDLATSSQQSTEQQNFWSSCVQKERKISDAIRAFFRGPDSDASSDSPADEILNDIDEDELNTVKHRIETRRKTISKGHLPFQKSFELLSIAGSSSTHALKAFEDEEKQLIEKQTKAKKARELFTEAEKKLKQGENDLGVPLPDDVSTVKEKATVLAQALLTAADDLKDVKKKRDEIRREKADIKRKLLERKQKGESAPVHKKTDHETTETKEKTAGGKKGKHSEAGSKKRKHKTKKTDRNHTDSESSEETDETVTDSKKAKQSKAHSKKKKHKTKKTNQKHTDSESSEETDKKTTDRKEAKHDLTTDSKNKKKKQKAKEKDKKTRDSETSVESDEKTADSKKAKHKSKADSKNKRKKQKSQHKDKKSTNSKTSVKSDEEKQEDSSKVQNEKDETRKESDDSTPPTSCIGRGQRKVKKFCKEHTEKALETSCATFCIARGEELKGKVNKKSEECGRNIRRKKRQLKKYCREHGEKILEEHSDEWDCIKRSKKNIKKLCEETESEDKESEDTESEDTESDESSSSDSDSKDTDKESGSGKDSKDEDGKKKSKDEDGKKKLKDKMHASASSKSSSSSSSVSSDSRTSESTQKSSSSSSYDSESETETGTSEAPTRPAAKPVAQQKAYAVAFGATSHITSSEDWPSHTDVIEKASDSSIYAPIRLGKKIRDAAKRPKGSSSGSISLEDWPSHSQLKAANILPWEDDQKEIARSLSAAFSSVDNEDGLSSDRRLKQRSIREQRKDEGPFQTHIEKRSTGRITPWRRDDSSRSHALIASSKSRTTPRDQTLSTARLRRRLTKSMESSSSEYMATSAGKNETYNYETGDADHGLTKLQMSEVTEVIQQTIQAYNELQNQVTGSATEEETSKHAKDVDTLIKRVRKLEFQYFKNEQSYTMTRRELETTQKQLQEAKELRKTLRRKLTQVQDRSHFSAKDLNSVNKNLGIIADLKDRIQTLENEDKRKEEEIGVAKVQLKHAEAIMQGLWREVSRARLSYKTDLQNIQMYKTNTAHGISNVLDEIQTQVHGIQENTADLKHGLHHIVRNQSKPIPKCVHVNRMHPNSGLDATMENFEELIPVDFIKDQNYITDTENTNTTMICEEALEQFRKYKALIEELMVKVFPFPFYFKHRKATLYEKTMYLLMHGKSLDAENLPNPGEHLEERITGFREGSSELQELLALDSLHQICVLLQYLGDECLRVLNKVHSELSSSSKYLPSEISFMTKFDISNWTEPVDEITLVTYMGKLMVKINHLVDSLVSLKERYHPPKPRWYNRTQQFHLKDQDKKSSMRHGTARQNMKSMKKQVHWNPQPEGFASSPRSRPWKTPVAFYQNPNLHDKAPPYYQDALHYQNQLPRDMNKVQFETSNNFQKLYTNPAEESSENSYRTADNVQITYDKEFTNLDVSPRMNQEPHEFSKTQRKYEQEDVCYSECLENVCDRDDLENVCKDECSENKKPRKRNLIKKLRRRVRRSMYFRNVYS